MKDLTRFPIACLVLLTLSLLPLRARAGGYTNLSIAVHFQYQEVQAQATLLQARLDERQRALAEVYTAYELDGPSAQKLQIEIVELQRSLLANHHRMQVELRKAVGRERFDLLRRRPTQIAAPAAAANRLPPRTDLRRDGAPTPPWINEVQIDLQKRGTPAGGPSSPGRDRENHVPIERSTQ